MSGVSDNYGFVLPAAGEAYDVEILNGNFKQADKELKKRIYLESNYTPTFANINNLGSGFVANGYYTQVGKVINYSFYLKGGAGTVLGAQFITVSLPKKAASITNQVWYGQAGLHNPGINGLIYPLVVPVVNGATTAQILAYGDSKDGLINPGTKVLPWDPNDVIRGNVVYLTDDV